jgi:hypothetical protein
LTDIPNKFRPFPIYAPRNEYKKYIENHTELMSSRGHQMTQVSIGVDLKIAGTLAAATALFGGITVPLLLPSIFELVPPAQRTLPLPLPLFSVLVATQFLIFYCALAWAGLRLARARNREPAPWLTSVWSRQRRPDSASGVGLAFGTGFICGLILVGADCADKTLSARDSTSRVAPVIIAGVALSQHHRVV